MANPMQALLEMYGGDTKRIMDDLKKTANASKFVAVRQSIQDVVTAASGAGMSRKMFKKEVMMAWNKDTVEMPVKPRKPNAWAAFRSKYYSVVKAANPGKDRKELEAILGSMYKTPKTASLGDEGANESGSEVATTTASDDNDEQSNRSKRSLTSPDHIHEIRPKRSCRK